MKILIAILTLEMIFEGFSDWKVELYGFGCVFGAGQWLWIILVVEFT